MSDSQYTSLLHLTSDGAAALPRLPLNSGTYSEAWLQDLIFAHPECLPLQELDPSYGPLIPVCKEMETGAGPVDIVYINPDGMLTLVECKLWRNPEARREVVGQILDYAKELGRWHYEDLQREVSRALKKQGNQLLEIVSAQQKVEEAVFIDNVARHLRDGRFQLLILGDGIRQGVERIAEFLKGHAGMHFSFGLVEMAVFGMAGGSHILQPRVLARTTLIERYTVQMATPDMQLAQQADGEAEDDADISDSQNDNFIFWTTFLKQLKLDDVSQAVPAASRHANLWFFMPGTRNHVWITVFRAKSSNRIGVFLKCMDKSELAKQVYLRLKEQRSEIDAELGAAPEWREDEPGFKIVISKKYSQSLQQADIAEQVNWLSVHLNSFVNVFRPRIEEIAEEIGGNRI